MIATPTYRTDVRRMADLSAIELYAMLKLRVDVFVVEQDCAYPELDGKDADALHLRLLADDDILACARILSPVSHGNRRIGRAVVSPAQRGKDLGRVLMNEAIAHCSKLYPGMAIEISAQEYLLAFYAGLGFVPISGSYVEDGIAHVAMIRMAS